MNDIFSKIFEFAKQNNFSDIHITENFKPFFRNKSGDVVNISPENEEFREITKELIIQFFQNFLNDEAFRKFTENLELDISFPTESGNRFRLNAYYDTNGICLAMRQIPDKIPTFEEVGFPESFKELFSKPKGLILFTGATGSGKSTNMAAAIDYINKNFHKHIITIEDPVEFSFTNHKSVINQREVGGNTKGFSNAIRSAFRGDPDVIVIGEMRDPETIKSALTLAETGHLVLSTLHTNDAPQTIDRIIDSFDSESAGQIRLQLAMGLTAIVSQMLLPRSDKAGLIASREILINNHAVANMILERKTKQIYSIIEVGQKEGMILMDNYLVKLFKKGFISEETLFVSARDEEAVSMMIQ